jgi:hypothetical protein
VCDICRLGYRDLRQGMGGDEVDVNDFSAFRYLNILSISGIKRRYEARVQVQTQAQVVRWTCYSGDREWVPRS